jgi:hypothetical protein
MLQLTGTVLLRHAGTQSIRPLQKEHDAYQQALDRLLRDLRVEKA